MVIRRISPLSAGKLVGTLGAIIGAPMGFAAAWLLLGVAAAGAARNDPARALLIGLIGFSALVVVPLACGGMGFAITALTAWLYNVVAGIVGGMEVDQA